jgi:hypothetical protein
MPAVVQPAQATDDVLQQRLAQPEGEQQRAADPVRLAFQGDGLDAADAVVAEPDEAVLDRLLRERVGHLRLAARPRRRPPDA